MAVVYFWRVGDKLKMSDKKPHRSNGKEVFVGFPRFIMEAEGQLKGEGDDIEKMMGKMEERKPYKMVLREWPIE